MSELKLGRAIPPDTPHGSFSIIKAVSVSLPKWSHNIGYEEGDPAIVNSLETGYPRFVLHKSVEKLFQLVQIKFCTDNEVCFVFPTRQIAQECRQFVNKTDPMAKIRIAEQELIPRVHGYKSVCLYILIFEHELFHKVKQFWQHTGEIVSSRFAEYCLGIWSLNSKSVQLLINPYKTDRNLEPVVKAESLMFVEERFGRNMSITMANEAKRTLKERICKLARQSSASSEKTVQFGFPYLDTLKIQEKFNECIFLGHGNSQDLHQLKSVLEKQEISAVFCEFPSNPLLQCADLLALRKLATEHKFLLIVDDTIGTWMNTTVSSVADIIVTSLTKVFSGDSNVMGGSLLICEKSPFFTKLSEFTISEYIWDEDLIFIERNSRTVETRIKTINSNTKRLVDLLKSQEIVNQVFYPDYSRNYEEFNKNSDNPGGFGGLFSIKFKKPEDAINFYDSLQCCKGPSLGTNFTLCCPYTILAHYNELDWAEDYGVSRWLVRVSVGIEPIEDLLSIFESASISLIKRDTLVVQE